VQTTCLHVTYFAARKKIPVYARRQNFIVFLSLMCVVASSGAKVSTQPTLTLRVGLVTRPNPATAAVALSRGVRLGAAEATETAALFGGQVQLFEESTDNERPDAAAERLLSKRKVQVLIAASPEDVDALSRFADGHGLIFVNAASRASALRSACRRNTFHVEASDSMYANTLRRMNADVRGDSAVLWTSTLEKYGASQINERYRNKYGAPMDGSAWAGWVAVKIVAEAALRAQSARTDPLRSRLEAPATSFDGHKGWPLSFRGTDHQLRQPLYIVSRAVGRANPVVRDVPQLSALSEHDVSTNQLLDQLMPRTPACHRSSK